MLGRFFGVRSQVFRAEITPRVGSAERKYIAILRRMGAAGRVQDTRVLNFYSANPNAGE